jgi:hypothetical protein
MYIIRETFIAKPGYAGELARMMKKEMDNWKDFKGHVLLDIATDYNTIVCEYEIDSLATFEKMMTEYKQDQAKKKSSKPPKYTQLYQTGKREIFKVVE